MRIEPQAVGMVGREPDELKGAGSRAQPVEEGASVVTLSAAGSAAARSEDRVDPVRIAAIRAAIRTGAYRIELDQLAQKIVEDEALRGR